MNGPLFAACENRRGEPQVQRAGAEGRDQGVGDLRLAGARHGRGLAVAGAEEAAAIAHMQAGALDADRRLWNLGWPVLTSKVLASGW